MRDRAQPAGPEVAEQHAPPAGARLAVARVGDRDEVRLRLEAERLGEPPRAGVVVGQSLDVMLERVERGRGDDARLAHGAAEEVFPLPGALDELRGPCEDG